MSSLQQRLSKASVSTGEGGVKVVRVTTPGPTQVVTFGFVVVTLAFFGLIYTLAPGQLVRSARLPEGSLSPAVLAWVHMVIRGWGSGLLGVAGVLALVGMHARVIYLAPVVLGCTQFFVYAVAYAQLDHSVFPIATVYTHLGLATAYVVMGAVSYQSMPPPATYEFDEGSGKKNK